MNLCLLECSLVPAPLHAQAHGPSKKSCSFFTQQLLREDEGVRLRWHLTEDVLSSQPFLAKLDPSASKGTWGKMSFLSHWWDMGDIQESKPWGVQKIKRSSCGYTSDIISKLPLWIIMELGIVWKMLTSPKSKRARFGTSLWGYVRFAVQNELPSSSRHHLMSNPRWAELRRAYPRRWRLEGKSTGYFYKGGLVVTMVLRYIHHYHPRLWEDLDTNLKFDLIFISVYVVLYF